MNTLSRALAFALENPHSDFYRRKYGTEYRSLIDAPLKNLPLLTRDDIDRVPLEDRIFVPKQLMRFIRATSGSSGRRVTGFPMAEDPELMRVRMDAGYLEEEARAARYFGPYMQRGTSTGLLLFSAVGVIHETQLWGVDGTPIVVADLAQPELTARLARAAGVDSMFMFPSPLVSLIPVFTAAGLAERITFIMLVGERVTEGQRAAIARAFPRAKVTTVYASTESQGFAAVTCARRVTLQPSLVHPSSAYELELVHPDTGESLTLTEGAEGEIVLTTLLPVVFPLIRYRTGDYAVVRGNGLCSCGSVAPLIELLGRVELDRVKIPFGGISVAALEEAILSLGIPVSDFSAQWREHAEPRFLSVTLFTSEPARVELAPALARALPVNATQSYEDISLRGAVGPLHLEVRPASALTPAKGKRKRLVVEH